MNHQLVKKEKEGNVKKKWKGEKDSNLSNPYSFYLIYYQTENSFAQPTGKKKEDGFRHYCLYTLHLKTDKKQLGGKRKCWSS